MKKIKGMRVSLLNKFMLSIICYLLVGFFLIKLEWDHVAFQFIWEITFLPSVLAGFVFAIVTLVKIYRGFQKSFSNFLGIVLSLVFIGYFVVLINSIIEA